MRVAFVEWPEGLSPDGAAWPEVSRSVAAANPDILVTNELPFGSWIAEGSAFSGAEANASIRSHERGLKALIDLGVRAVISSRPVRKGSRLANEAFVLEDGGAVRALHRKQHFPNEPGWFESEWFAGDGSGFEAAEILGLRVGVLLCTDAMFNEHARAYGKQGAALIVIPRASGTENRRRHGVARVRRLRGQLESGRTLEGRHAVRRLRLRLRAGREASRGDVAGRAPQSFRARFKSLRRRPARVPLLCSGGGVDKLRNEQ